MSHPSYYTPSTGYRPTPNGTLNDPKFSLRKIDAAAILACLLLLRIAFAPSDITSGGIVNFGDSNIGASMELQFYSAFNSKDGNAARPVPIDIDGDGVVDALVVPEFTNEQDVMHEKEAETAALKSKSSTSRNDGGDTNTIEATAWGGGKWGIRVLNLKPLHSRDEENDGPNDGPFAPRTMFLSPLLDSESSSEASNSIREDVYPVKLLSVQIPIQRTKLGDEERSRQRHKKAEPSSITGYATNSAIPPKDDANKEYDRKRHYFCGRDWHHASQSCHKHCGGGTSTECGEGETCYADTPCDAMLPLETFFKDTNENEETDLALTVRGTLPGITTIWSDGGVTLHAITADIPVTVDPKNEHRGKRERQRKKKPELEMRQLWRVEMRQLWRVFPLDTASSSTSHVLFEELGFAYESGAIYGVSEETITGEDGSKIVRQNQIGHHGAILLGGRYTTESSTSPKVSYHALDVLSGAPLWELGSRGWTSAKRGHKKTEAEFIVPIIHTTSSARRRSHLPVKDAMDSELDNENSFVEGDDVMTSEECMAHFRYSVFDEANGALPHEFWEGDKGVMNVGRFERMKKSPRKKSRTSNKKSQIQKDLLIGQGSLTTSGGRQIVGTMGSSRGGTNTGSWQIDFLHRAIPKPLINQQISNSHLPLMGKPNVVMFHGRDGLAVLSLKNGSPVCHISLVDNTLYADIDKDGIVDVIQVVTPSDESRSGDIQSLIDRINKSEGAEDGHVSNRADPVFCHALVTSGLPPREEVFTAPLCLGGAITSANQKMRIRAAPPLLVESSIGRGNDIIFAINNGVIVRYDSNGREIWRKKAAKDDGSPSWRYATALLARVQFGAIKSHSSVSASSRHDQHRPGSPVRPILISGESGAAVISPAGKVLSHVVYPQPAIIQPLLADLNGDGTDDLLVVSKDALWGYRIVVETGRSGFFRS